MRLIQPGQPAAQSGNAGDQVLTTLASCGGAAMPMSAQWNGSSNWGASGAGRLTVPRADRAYWETQRCVIPVTRCCTKVGDVDTHWQVSALPLVYVAGVLQFDITESGRQARCSVVLARQDDQVGAMPLYLVGLSPTQWLALDGTAAAQALGCRWDRIGGGEAAASKY